MAIIKTFFWVITDRQYEALVRKDLCVPNCTCPGETLLCVACHDNSLDYGIAATTWKAFRQSPLYAIQC